MQNPKTKQVNKLTPEVMYRPTIQFLLLFMGLFYSEFRRCPHKEYAKWKEWYLQQQPKAIDEATKKVFAMVEELKKAINLIDESLIRKWVEDLVIDKTFIGLKFQEAIL